MQKNSHGHTDLIRRRMNEILGQLSLTKSQPRGANNSHAENQSIMPSLGILCVNLNEALVQAQEFHAQIMEALKSREAPSPKVVTPNKELSTYRLIELPPAQLARLLPPGQRLAKTGAKKR
ncbi:unnamed protein product, partial [Protopolystoma xenopodis]